MKKLFFTMLFLATSLCFSQSVNDYKYAIVPSKFEFFKDKDQYRLNTLTKLLMEKYGFVTYFDTDILPSEVAESNCNKVYVELKNTGNLFKTKLVVVLKDCKNQVLFTSLEGISKEKEYLVAYTQALREAFTSFDKLEYKYSGMQNVKTEEVSNYKMITKDATLKIQENGIMIVESDLEFQNLLVAETIKLGYLLIDPKTSTIVLKLYKTSNDNVFIANSNTINGVVIRKGQEIFFEYYQDKNLISKKLNVSF
jgi:hypothetical protein